MFGFLPVRNCDILEVIDFSGTRQATMNKRPHIGPLSSPEQVAALDHVKERQIVGKTAGRKTN